MTVQYLLARRKFDELEVIADEKNNSTYFINNQPEGVHSLKIFSEIPFSLVDVKDMYNNRQKACYYT